MHAKPLFNSPSRPVRKEARTSAKPGELHGPLHERERLPLQVSILIGEVWGVIRVVVIAVVMGVMMPCREQYLVHIFRVDSSITTVQISILKPCKSGSLAELNNN